MSGDDEPTVVRSCRDVRVTLKDASGNEVTLEHEPGPFKAFIDREWEGIKRETDPRVLAEWKAGKSLQMSAVMIEGASTLLNIRKLLPRKRWPWRRAIRSRSRRIRAKGRKAEARALWPLRMAIMVLMRWQLASIQAPPRGTAIVEPGAFR